MPSFTREIGAVENIHGALPYIPFAPILALVGVGVNRIGKRRTSLSKARSIAANNEFLFISMKAEPIFLNYSGFDEVKDNDSQSIIFNDVIIGNTSIDHHAHLHINLRIQSDSGTDATLRGDAKDGFGRILGKHDRATASLKKFLGEGQKYIYSPLRLGPNEISEGRMAFVLPLAPADLRNKITREALKHKWQYELQVTDHITGITVTMNVPGEYRGDGAQ